jgi:prolyl oligopeptidase
VTTPPATRRDDTVDTLHGVEVADPYRWLEDIETPEVAEWVRAQNAVTAEWLAAHATSREEIRGRIAQLWQFTLWGAPVERGGRWFTSRRDPGADQPVVVVADEPESAGRVLLDPAEFGVGDATATIAGWQPSPDGRLLAYARSDAGSDWMTWRVRDVDTGEDLPDEVRWSKFCLAAWLGDGSGFVYSAFDPPAANEDATAMTVDSPRVTLHRLGAAQADDVVLHQESDRELMPESQTSDDGRWLVMHVAQGTRSDSMVRAIDLRQLTGTARDGVIDVVEQPFAAHEVVGVEGTTFFLLTDHDAPMRRIVATDLDDPDRARREVVSEGPDRIVSAVRAGQGFVVHLLHDASSRLEVHDGDGGLPFAVELPPAVSVVEMHGHAESDLVGFTMASFTEPVTAWLLDSATGEVRRVHDAGAAVADLADDIVVERAGAPSRDGTVVPLFLIHRRDVEPTGQARTLLYGYGGFDIPITPDFKPHWRTWVERGGLLAVANLRGGGEFGRAWYDAGRRDRKQNVFDDMCGCAEWLAASGWTSPSRIVINGGSNGGLLVGACLTQRPELFGAAVPEVGVLDLFRFHTFTIGWAWTSDYGDPGVAAEFEWVRGYSPLHNVRPGQIYPPTLITTGDHDDRVLPAHSYKFAATLQAAQGQAGGPDAPPVLLRIDVSAGHGAGKPTSKVIDERADVLAFAEATLG